MLLVWTEMGVRWQGLLSTPHPFAVAAAAAATGRHLWCRLCVAIVVTFAYREELSAVPDCLCVLFVFVVVCQPFLLPFLSLGLHCLLGLYGLVCAGFGCQEPILYQASASADSGKAIEVTPP